VTRTARRAEPVTDAADTPPAGAPAPGAAEHLRVLEALLFAAPAPLATEQLARELPPSADLPGLLKQLQADYARRGVNLSRVAGKWAFRTATDLGYLLEKKSETEKRLSRAALETLAIIAYHQPVTRAEVEAIRGVATSKGTLDVLMETGWVRLRGRRRAPGRPVTYGTTEGFLSHFGLESLADLPGAAELKGAGLLDSSLPAGFKVPDPELLASLQADELPLEDEDEAGTEDTSKDVEQHTNTSGGDAKAPAGAPNSSSRRRPGPVQTAGDDV
jgi:segregation and condensation protein B